MTAMYLHTSGLTAAGRFRPGGRTLAATFVLAVPMAPIAPMMPVGGRRDGEPHRAPSLVGWIDGLDGPGRPREGSGYAIAAIVDAWTIHTVH